MLATTLPTSARRSAGLSFAAHFRTSLWTSSSRFRAMKIIALTRSAPSSIVTFGLCSKRRGDVPVVAVLVLALDGVDGDAEILDQAGGDVVLGRQGVRRAKQQVGAAGLERPGQVGRLGGDVQAGRHPHAGQRLIPGEALADRPQDRHVPFGPLHALAAGLGQRQILDIPTRPGEGRSHGCQCRSPYLLFLGTTPPPSPSNGRQQGVTLPAARERRINSGNGRT